MSSLLLDNTLDNTILGKEVYSIMENVLTERELDIVFSRIMTNTTYKDIGLDHNLSVERVRQIFFKSMRIIKYHATVRLSGKRMYQGHKVYDKRSII